MSAAVQLPNEILLEVFEWLNAEFRLSYSLEYAPFIPRYEQVQELRRTMRLGNRTLALVCKDWHALVYPWLRSEVDIGSMIPELNLDCVLHSILPYTATATAKYDAPLVKKALSNIKRLPNMRTLVRPRHADHGIAEPPLFDFFANTHPLPDCFALLRRLEWSIHNSAHITLGVNSLCEVLAHTPRLEYLQIEGSPHNSVLPLACVRLPTLRTLHLVRANFVLTSRIARWELLALVHVVVEFGGHVATLQPLWDAFGPQLRSGEFGAHLDFRLNDYVTPLLATCALEQLALHVHFVGRPFRPLDSATLRRLHWHARPNLAAAGASDAHVADHVHWLCGARRTPELACLVLHGDWAGLLQSARLREYLEFLQERRPGLRIEWPDGRLVFPALPSA